MARDLKELIRESLDPKPTPEVMAAEERRRDEYAARVADVRKGRANSD